MKNYTLTRDPDHQLRQFQYCQVFCLLWLFLGLKIPFKITLYFVKLNLKTKSIYLKAKKN